MPKIQNPRGTKDLYFKDAKLFEHVIDIARQVLLKYGFGPIYTPIFEFTEVFKRTLGNYSDVVGKEMYNFEDRGGESMTLRPEFTASIVRACITNGLQHELPLRFYSFGPLFRYERPQKGRQRQFHQINVEALGIDDPYADGEIIKMGYDLLTEFGLSDKISLNLNSLGCSKSREKYLIHLHQYLTRYKNDLSQYSQARLDKNVLRILDSKELNDQKIVAGAPQIRDFYTKESAIFFDKIQEYLTLAQVPFVINKSLVRGLDYYCHTIFEFVTTHLGAQGTVLGGGRYNDLSKMLGGSDIPAIGFAAGIERLMLLFDYAQKDYRPIAIIADDRFMQRTIAISNILRSNNFVVINDFGISLSKKMKRANKINAKLTVFIDDDLITDIKVRDLDSGRQVILSQDTMINDIRRMLYQ